MERTRDSPTKFRARTTSEDGGPRVAESRVLVLYTGGTIGMRTGADGVYAPEAGYLPRAVAKLPPLHDVVYAEDYHSGLPAVVLCGWVK